MRLLAIPLLLLWLQLFWSLIPTWRFGEYYSYGWFVPPIAIAFAWRRWQIATETPRLVVSDPRRLPGWAFALLVLGVLLTFPLRIIELADAGWRPPILLHALIVVAATHMILWKAYSARISFWFVPVTIFASTAVPYLWSFEQNLVRRLTGTVVGLAREIFLINGRPVDVLGERLTLGKDAVDVTEGCSGIRSLQSLVMAALFFGELLFLSLSRRIALLLVAAICAIIVNSARAYLLAEIHFSSGKDAATSLHDLLGHVAFAISAASLYLAAFLMQKTKDSRRLVVTRTKVAPI